MKSIRTTLIGGLLLTLLSSCAGKPDATRYYLLTDPTESLVSAGASLPLRSLALGTVNVPSYLQSRNIAVIVGSTEIRGARSHRWAEPLDEALRRYLQETLAAGFAIDAPYLLDMTVHHLHGAESGAVLLDIDWRVRERGSAAALVAGQFADAVQQSGVGFDALVVAHRQLLDRFVAQVVVEAGAAVGGGGGVANQKHSAPTSDAPAMTEKPSS